MNLKFFKDREALAGPDGFQLGHRHEDRTVSVVKKWIALSTALKAARQATISHCEVIEGKNGIVSLRVADRAGFETLQAQIKAQSEELTAVEAAICKLDEIANGGELWFGDVEFQCGNYGNVEGFERRRLANLASATLSRQMNSGKTAEEILSEDEEYQRISKIAEEQIANANKQLETLRPKLEEMKQLLADAGC